MFKRESQASSVARCAAIAFLLIAAAAWAQRPKLTAVEGHWSPLEAKITYRNGKTQDVLVVANGYNNGGGSPSHTIEGTGDGGGGVRIWMDTIRLIKNSTDKEFTVVYKDGTERDLETIGIRNGLIFMSGPETTEYASFADCKTIEFKKPARKDAKDNAMFDHWKYSPFTGEKLPEE